jgi:hypothetical protein
LHVAAVAVAATVAAVVFEGSVERMSLFPSCATPALRLLLLLLLLPVCSMLAAVRLGCLTACFVAG